MEDSVYLEDKKLANDVLERNFYQPFREGRKFLELFITGICRANCDYCYLKKNQKELYPLKIHNNEQILKNLRYVLEWYVKQEFKCNISIFSAEWITLPIANQVFDIIYDVFSKAKPENRPKVIDAADNMQFLKNDKAVIDLEKNIDRLKELGIMFFMSASVDGKYCDYDRTENSDEFYIKLRDFLDKHNFNAHPMVSSDNIKYWIQNKQWWDNFFSPRITEDLMTLEVRDNTWNEESIQSLIQYCDFLIDRTEERFNGNKNQLLRYILGLPINDGESRSRTQYNIIGFNLTQTCDNMDPMGCSIHGSLPIRLGDLGVAPCHRLFYNELMMGKFETDENGITEFAPQNVSLLILYNHLKRTSIPKCENCKFQGVCTGHCNGASYEEYRNPLVPQKEVCNMYKAKYSFIIYKCHTLSLFDEMPKLRHYFSDIQYMYLCDLINGILGTNAVKTLQEIVEEEKNKGDICNNGR